MKINLNNDDGNDARKHFGFTITGGKDKNAPVKIDAVIVGTPADQAGLQVFFCPFLAAYYNFSCILINLFI